MILNYLNDLFYSSRVAYLQDTVNGLEKTGVPLITYEDGTYGIPFGGTDDLGFYYFTELFAHFFKLPVELAMNILFIGLIAISSILALVGFCLLFKDKRSRIISAIGVTLLFIVQFLVGYAVDYVYIAPSILIGLLPLNIYLLNRCNLKIAYPLMLLQGMLAESADFIRAMSGTGFVLILFILIFGAKKIKKIAKLLLCIFVMVGILLMSFVISDAISNMKNYLEESSQNITYNDRHVVWAQIYIGFGFLQNDMGITYIDDCAAEKLHEYNSNLVLGSKESEHFFKTEVVKIIKSEPIFVLKTLFAKAGVLLAYIFIFANIGIIYAFKYRKKFCIDVAFFMGMIFYSIYGILANPARSFILVGLIATAAIWGILSIAYGICENRSSEKEF